MKTEYEARQQLELTLSSASRLRTVKNQQRREFRANWWFKRMRAVVDRALASHPAAPPEQVYLNLDNRARSASRSMVQDWS